MSISILNIEHDHSFEFLYEIASVEKFDTSSTLSILNKVVSTASDVKEKISRLLNRYDYVQFIDVNKRKLYKKLEKYNYLDLQEVHVFKPIGLKSPYIDLLTTIKAVQEDLLSIDQRVLTPFLKWSGEVLNSPQKLQRLNVDKEMFFLNTKKYNKYLDKHFNKNDNSDVAKFGDLFQYSKQMLDIVNLFNEIAAIQNQLPAKKLLKMVDDIAKRAEMLVRRCQIDKDSQLCSSASKKVIADVLYDIGTEITLYSRLSYNIISAQGAIEDSANKILSMS